MERWLNSSAWQCPASWKKGDGLPQSLYTPDKSCDEEIIKISWLMNYEL